MESLNPRNEGFSEVKGVLHKKKRNYTPFVPMAQEPIDPAWLEVSTVPRREAGLLNRLSLVDTA